MSNDVTSMIEIHDGGKLTPEEVDIAVYGEQEVAVADALGHGSYYRAYQEKSGRIKIRTKWAPPVSRIAALAYTKRLNLTMEFDSLDKSEVGSLSFFVKDHALEDGVTREDYYPPVTKVAEHAPECARRRSVNDQ
jgi:hypothetical protein